MPLEISTIRRQFPFLEGTPCPIYLDSAAMAQVPRAVLDAVTAWEHSARANVHRGMHARVEQSTEAYEHARHGVQRFINAERPEEIVFTHGCTESINFIARSYGDAHLSKGDAIVLSLLEHHSNIIPWQQLAKRTGAVLHWMDIDDAGAPRIDELENYLRQGNVKIVSITAQSNVLGVRPDLSRIVEMAHRHGAVVIVDAAQAVAHMPIDVQNMDCDFLAFSGHKLYAPTGIGVLYGRRKILEQMPPFLGGGMTIAKVTTDDFVPADIPTRFEAGTPPIAGAIGLSAAIDWLGKYAWEDIVSHEQSILEYAIHQLSSVKGLRILGAKNESANERTNDLHGCLSFTLDSVHPHDLTDILGKQGIALRAGHHCCMPLHKRLGINASTRLSIGIYTAEEEIDACVTAMRSAIALLNT